MSQNQSVVFVLQEDQGKYSLRDIFEDLQFLKENSILPDLNLKIANDALYQGRQYVADFKGGFLPVAGEFTELRKALSLLPYLKNVSF